MVMMIVTVTECVPALYSELFGHLLQSSPQP